VGWRVQRVQERLAWLGYDISEGNLVNERMGESTIDAVKQFQSKFGFRPTGTVGPGTYELLGVIAGRVGRLPKGCLGERAICIDKAQRLVRLVEDDEVVLTLDARFGFVGAETREGTFRVQRKSRDHTSSLYRTWMPFALFFSGGQAVHYSPYFARDGYNGGSHGCVNLRDFDRARWLFDRVPMGTPVHVYRS
jgi:peptidoglycan hydrolase-like protein with peptidoglycan-binding domain